VLCSRFNVALMLDATEQRESESERGREREKERERERDCRVETQQYPETLELPQWRLMMF
jgi:hypothetical protein